MGRGNGNSPQMWDFICWDSLYNETNPVPTG